MRQFFANIFVPESTWEGTHKMFLIRAKDHVDAVAQVQKQIPDVIVYGNEVIEITGTGKVISLGEIHIEG